MIENFKDLNVRTTQDTCRISVFKFKVIFNEKKKISYRRMFNTDNL